MNINNNEQQQSSGTISQIGENSTADEMRIVRQQQQEQEQSSSSQKQANTKTKLSNETQVSAAAPVSSPGGGEEKEESSSSEGKGTSGGSGGGYSADCSSSDTSSLGNGKNDIGDSGDSGDNNDAPEKELKNLKIGASPNETPSPEDEEDDDEDTSDDEYSDDDDDDSDRKPAAIPSRKKSKANNNKKSKTKTGTSSLNSVAAGQEGESSLAGASTSAFAQVGYKPLHHQRGDPSIQWNGVRITHPMDPRIDLSTVGYIHASHLPTFHHGHASNIVAQHQHHHHPPAVMEGSLLHPGIAFAIPGQHTTTTNAGIDPGLGDTGEPPPIPTFEQYMKLMEVITNAMSLIDQGINQTIQFKSIFH